MTGGGCGANDGLHLSDAFVGQPFDYGERVHERDHGAIANERDDKQNAEREVGESEKGHDADYGLCGGGSECVQRDAVGGLGAAIGAENGDEGYASIHDRDQHEEPERDFAAAIVIVECAGENSVQHA